jgi:hypothetical protein
MRTPLRQPENATNPKSPEATQAVVERYCDLLKARRYSDAHQLWSGDTLSDAEFARHWAGYGKLEDCSVDKPGAAEGAAGSIYTTVFVELFFNGGLTKLSGALTLRRINDVPGSTEEQRSWHITKSDLKPAD